MSAIDWVTIEGFKSVRRIERLPLRPINVLIGPNGSGKSNFIGAMSLFHITDLVGIGSMGLITRALQDFVGRSGGADKILHFGSKTTKQIRLEIKLRDFDDICLREILLGEEDTLYFRLPPKTKTSGVSYESRRHIFENMHPYHFHDTGPSSPLKKTADLHDNRGLRPDGANLAAFLYLLREKHDREYDLIRRTVRLAVPFFDDFQLAPLALNEDKIHLEWRHRGSNAYFNASSLSDGSLRFIALATLLLQPAALRPPVVLMDEPELGLHPCAVALLAALVKQASMETQVILATQSPIVLDHFEPEDVLVADRVDSATNLSRLEPEALKEWLNDYSLGQLWEKNEFGGRPASEA